MEIKVEPVIKEPYRRADHPFPKIISLVFRGTSVTPDKDPDKQQDYTYVKGKCHERKNAGKQKEKSDDDKNNIFLGKFPDLFLVNLKVFPPAFRRNGIKILKLVKYLLFS